MKKINNDTMNILLTIPTELNRKLCAEAGKEHRSRQAQIVYTLEKLFEKSPNGNGKKEKTK